MAETGSKRLYVGNLPYQAIDKDIEVIFTDAGFQMSVFQLLMISPIHFRLMISQALPNLSDRAPSLVIDWSNKITFNGLHNSHTQRLLVLANPC